MKPQLTLLPVLFVFIICSCSKPSDPVPVVTSNTISWDGLVFGRYTYGHDNSYFSTIDTSFRTPLNASQAQPKADKIDLVYIYNSGYSAPGFMDPYTLTQHWYWDEYYTPWLTNAYHTKFYMTKLSKLQYDSAKADGSKFQVYFSDTTKVYVAPHRIFPIGTCIGGRGFCAGVADCAINDISLVRGKVYGFISNNKKGFIYVRTDQNPGWPTNIINADTKVDIVKEK